MNILIPHSWLLEHLDTDVKPAEMQRCLSLCGPSVERIYEREGEAIYDIEVTTNRVDSMSVRGIAREAAVILKQFGHDARLKPLPAMKYVTKTFKPVKTLPLPTIMNNVKLCPRTFCVVLQNANRTPTPAWMAKRLRQIEINVHDSVIDITNYITHELGHPCHAFDYDQIMKLGGTIEVKLARKGKKFTTLDGVKYTTVGGEVVYENEKGEIIDLPGIKGTVNTSVNADTKNILLWMESIDAKKVRFASMTHAIRTVAAQLNEKNVDPHSADMVMEKGIELYKTLTGATVASPIYDDFPGRKIKPAVVKVPLVLFQTYLGVELPLNTIDRILRDLGCEVDLRSKVLYVMPPTFRPDITIPADVIEEVARIYGYHNLPSVVMATAIPLIKPTHTNFTLEYRIKQFLADIGWQELYTYSMVSEAIALQSGYSLAEHLKIQNPLSDDRVYLRRSLIPSLLEVIAAAPTEKNLSLFELACTYQPKPKALPDQPLSLTMLSTQPYQKAKGALEALLHQFFLTDITVEAIPKIAATSPYQVMGDVIVHVKKETVTLGQIGILKTGQTAAEIDIATLVKIAQTHPHYQPALKTSEIKESLTFTLPDKTAIGDVLTSLGDITPLLTSVELQSIFEHNFTFALTFSDPAHHLTDEDVAPLRQKIVAHMQKRWHGQLVGSLS